MHDPNLEGGGEMWQKAGLKYIVVLLQQLKNLPFLMA